MKTFRLFTFSVLMATFVACEKDDTTVQPKSNPIPPDVVEIDEAANYTMLKDSNYWVYQQVTIDLPTGERRESNRYDSMYVAGDTLVNGETYYNLRGTWFGMRFHRIVRNEGSRMIDPTGKVFFDISADFPERLSFAPNPQNMLIDSISWMMRNDTVKIENEAGNFISHYQYDGVFYLDPDFVPNSNYKVRNETEYYVKQIGIVRYTSYYSAPFDVYMELIRYRIQ